MSGRRLEHADCGGEVLERTMIGMGGGRVRSYICQKCAAMIPADEVRRPLQLDAFEVVTAVPA